MDIDIHDQIAELTIAPEGTRGSFTAEMMDAFDVALERIEADRNIRALVLKGNERYFSTGADFATLAATLEEFGENREAVADAIFERIYGRFLRLWNLRIPTVAALTGHAVGGGMGISLYCDIRIAAPHTKMGVNFPRLGFSPGMGISYLLPIYVGVGRAMDMLLSGELSEGQQLRDIGLVQDVRPAEEVVPTAVRYAQQIAAGAPMAVSGIKTLLRQHHLPELEGALRAEATLQAESLPSNDAKEGVAAMMEKRDPVFSGT